MYVFSYLGFNDDGKIIKIVEIFPIFPLYKLVTMYTYDLNSYPRLVENFVSF